MAFARWERPIVDDAGKPIPGAVVKVRREAPGFPLAVPLYADFAGSTTTDNPVTADAQGVAAFHVVGGFYRLEIVAPGFSRTLRFVAIGTAGGTDIDAYAIAGFTWAPETAITAPPSAGGCIRFNNADLAAATHVFVHKMTLSGTDASAWLAGLMPGAKSVKNRLMLAISDSREISWQVDEVSAVGDYLDLTVSGYAGPDSPQVVSDAGFVTLAREISGGNGGKGDKGDKGDTGDEGPQGPPGADGTGTGDMEAASYPDLVAIEALSGEGIPARTASNTWATRELEGTADEVTVSNPKGTAGNPKIALGAKSKATGKQAFWIPASAMKPKATNGAGEGTYDSGSNDITIDTLDFDTTTQEYAHFTQGMPKGWNEGTVTFVPYWTNTGGTSTQNVVWSLAGAAISNDDPLNATMGTAQTSNDTWLAQNDLHIGPESSAITIGGSPAESDLVVFQVSRVVGSDNMAGDALLIGIMLFLTFDAANDA
jgi:hypothetical protein